MFFTINLLNLWDPEMLFREDRIKLSFLQILTIPFLIVGLAITFPIDILTLPIQLTCCFK
jgi:hypothetical protein